jgi:hypothetical protein
MICARQQRPHFTIAQSKPAPSLCSAPYPPPPPTGMAQFRDKDRAALHCTAMRRFEPARTPYPHQPMIPTSSPRPGRGCAEDLLKRRNTRVAVAFRHGRNLGRMIGHAQRPRYVAIVLLSFFLTPIVSALPPCYFGPRPPSLLTSPHPQLPPSTHSPFKLSLCIPSLSCRHDPYIHFCNTTSTNATQCHVPATLLCKPLPSFNSHHTHACHWLANPLTTH